MSRGRSVPPIMLLPSSSSDTEPLSSLVRGGWEELPVLGVRLTVWAALALGLLLLLLMLLLSWREYFREARRCLIGGLRFYSVWC